MKKVRSSLNLDLDLSLTRAGAPTGMFSLEWPCLKVRNDVQSPAGLAVSRGITFYNVLAACYSLHCNRGGPGRPVVVGSGDCPLGFDVLFLSILAGTRR